VIFFRQCGKTLSGWRLIVFMGIHTIERSFYF
jgi:hypothetical protein